MAPDALVDQLIDNVINIPPADPPEYAEWTWADYVALNDDAVYFQHKYQLRQRWVTETITDPIRTKFATFWHNHFVTVEEVYDCPSFMWHYYTLLQSYSLGNFRTFVEQMGKSPAMLIYLNGSINRAEEPNENYARELMELFTMGESNGYTQDDIVAVARALTGWVVDQDNCDLNVLFDNNNFDNTEKTIFGETGAWGYNDVHELIFTTRAEQVSFYICEKIYRHYVYEKVDPEVIAEMAQTFQDNNWELAPVFKLLFKSAHFFSDTFINTRIKDHLEVMNTYFNKLGLEDGVGFNEEQADYLTYITGEMGQMVYNPVDVAGWPGYHNWLNENTLTFRWSYTAAFLYSTIADNPDTRTKLTQLARTLTSDNENDERIVTASLVRFFLNRDLDDDLFETAVQYFRSDIPSNYFDDGTWNLFFTEVPDQVVNLMFYLSRLPEFQLC